MIRILNGLYFFSLCLVFTCQFSFAKTRTEEILESLPNRHPGSQNYSFNYLQKKFRIYNRNVDVFLPQGPGAHLIKTAIVFGHGQAIGLEGYRETFIHLARKGIPVIFPQYDKNFFDTNWARLATDYRDLAFRALDQIRPEFQIESLVYSGHSKGAHVALMAAALPGAPKASAVVIFQPAAVNKMSLEKMNSEIPLSIFISEKDKVIKKDIPESIYEFCPSRFKQLIQIRSYENDPKLIADHFIILTKSYIFGGQNGSSIYHNFGFWKWLIGAVQDLEAGGQLNNDYIYGVETLSTGIAGFEHIKLKSNIK